MIQMILNVQNLLLFALPQALFRLDLPDYPSEEVLREKLLQAVHEGHEGFGFA